ncbi:NAD-dependent epimerase/dehydratase [Beggiatoa sp. PS]|nr:NAD-dependent epimerase/dehydratase [Beggiatoa sp. PS]
MNNFTQSKVLVTGATNQIGRFLLPRLQAHGFTITAISRQSLSNTTPNLLWQQADLLNTSLSLNSFHLLFHIAPLPLLPPLLACLPNDSVLKRVIAFSSTSCFTKAQSPDPKERAIATQLTEAETALITVCQARNIGWTLFRPTLIYGCGMDKNITTIAQFIRRYRFFPLLGQGTGLRQPVHADDLAAACIQASLSPVTLNKAYNLSGGQTLSYRDMVKSIFCHLGKKPRIISIPLPILKLIVLMFQRLPQYAHLSTAMITRMNQDLCFDHNEAYQDFGYIPRTFSDNDMGF